MPLHEEDTEKDKKIKVGEIVQVKHTNESGIRNIMHHRKYFALLKLVMANLPEELSDRIRSTEDLLTEIKLQIGYREKRISLGGKEYYIPKSISFEKMDQKKFEEFYSKSLDVICKFILTETTSEEIEQEIEGFM